VADGGNALWVGTTRGLYRWDLGQGRFSVADNARVAAVAADGRGGVWIATAKSVRRGAGKSWETFPPAPVGDFVTGLVPGSDGKSLWAGGPEGLARLRAGVWDRYLPDVGVTALVAGTNGNLWVGTSGRGVLRILRGGDRIAAYGAQQACEIDVVRGLSAGERGVFAVGEGPGGARAAYYDGTRFYSYAVESPSVLEWAAEGGGQLFVGTGTLLYQVEPSTSAAAGAVKLNPTGTPATKAAPIAPLAGGMNAAALDLAAGPPSARAKSAAPGPRLVATEAAVRLPDGVTTVASSARGLLVGTRFLGALRLENGVARLFRVADLTAGAARLTVACASAPDDCYLATGGPHAWRFDGQAFDEAAVDPEPGARVLAVVRDPRGLVIALHRGGDPQLRISSVVDGRWTPTAMQAVKVPLGVPELNFAAFAPDGHLWLGLRYLDRDRDAVDYGAAELLLDEGKVIYHNQSARAPLPNDMVAMYWKAPREAWFATRSGAARFADGKLRVFTENDGLESELISDIGPGLQGEVWVATRHGTGRFDGRRWIFPKMGPFYLPARSLGDDEHGHVFVGTDKGLYCVGDCGPDAIDARRGLLDDEVLDLTVDPRGRVWTLTQKGISIIEP
jgi:hypothetical protein